MKNPTLHSDTRTEHEPERTEREILWAGAMTCRMPVPVNFLPPRFRRREKTRRA